MTKLFSLTMATTLSLLSTSARADSSDFITEKYGVQDSAGAWLYVKHVQANKGNSSKFIPRPSDYEMVTEMGLIAFPKKSMLDTIDAGSSMYNEDMIRIFYTVVRSEKDVVIPLKIWGDDGFSVSVDGRFITGGESTYLKNFELELKAGVPVVLEIAGYNGPGAWALGLARQADDKPIETTPGVTIRAELKRQTPNFTKQAKKAQTTKKSTPTRPAIKSPKPEITVRNFTVEEKFGLVEITGDIRNMTDKEVKGLVLRFDFYLGRVKTDQASLKITGPFEPGRWEPFTMRVETKRFNDYLFSVTDLGNNPFLWAIQAK